MKDIIVILISICFLTVGLSGQEVIKYSAVGIKMNLEEISISHKIGKPQGGFGNEAMSTIRFSNQPIEILSGVELPSTGYYLQDIVNYHIPLSSKMTGLTLNTGPGMMLGIENIPLSTVLAYGVMWNVGVDYKIPEFPMNISLEWTPRIRWARGKFLFGEGTISARSVEPAQLYVGLRFTSLNKIFKR